MSYRICPYSSNLQLGHFIQIVKASICLRVYCCRLASCGCIGSMALKGSALHCLAPVSPTKKPGRRTLPPFALCPMLSYELSHVAYWRLPLRFWSDLLVQIQASRYSFGSKTIAGASLLSRLSQISNVVSFFSPCNPLIYGNSIKIVQIIINNN